MSVILATAGYDHKIRFWEAPSGVNSRTLRYPDSQVNCLEITPNKQFLAAGGNPQIRLFEINDTANHNPVLTLEGHTSSVTSLGFQRDVRYLYSGSEDGTVKLWDLRSPTFSRSFDCKAPVNSVALHPNQAEIISGDSNGSIKVWDLGTSKCINELVPDAHPTSSSSSTTSPTNGSSTTNALSSNNGTTGTATPSTNGNSNFTNSSSSSSSSSSSQHQRVSIQAVDISENGRTFIAATNHADVFIWDPSDSRAFHPLAKFQAHPTGTYLLKAKISPDSRHLVTTSSDRTARLWDISRAPTSNTPSPGAGAGAGPAGGNKDETQQEPAFQPSLTQTLGQHTKWVWDAVFSADSSYLVTASSDHSARLWNLRTGEVVRQYTGHQTAVTCVALNDSST